MLISENGEICFLIAAAAISAELMESNSAVIFIGEVFLSVVLAIFRGLNIILIELFIKITENNCLLWYFGVIIVGYNLFEEVIGMNVNPFDILTMKKNHPCGCNKMIVLRAGMDFKLRCEGCGHEFMVARSKIEKNIKSIAHVEEKH